MSSSSAAFKRLSEIVTKSEQEEIVLIAVDIRVVVIFVLSADSALSIAVLCVRSISYLAITAEMCVVVKVVVVEVVVVVVVVAGCVVAVVVAEHTLVSI